MPAFFDHEKLNTYQRSLDFVDFIDGVLVGLIRSQDADRIYEERSEYNADRP